MGWDHQTIGHKIFDAALSVLKATGIQFTVSQKQEKVGVGPDHEEKEQYLRTASFINLDGKLMVVEEYLAVHDPDCDGIDKVDITIYEVGRRPNIQTHIVSDIW